MSQKHNKYVVVEFVEEMQNGEVAMALVTSMWLEIENEETFCFWPTYVRDTHKINKLVYEHAAIDKKKSARCPINVKFSSANYHKSQEKMKVLEVQSNVTDEDEENIAQKRIPKKNHLYDEFIDGSSDSDSNGLPLPPRVPPITSSVTTELTTLQPLSPLYVEEPPATPSNDSNGHCRCAQMEGYLTNLTSEINKVREDLKYLLLIVQQSSTEVAVPDSTITRCDTTQQLEEINKNLESDSDLFKNMSRTLQTVGGRDVVDTTRRILASVMTNDVAKQCNWTGRNKKFNFGELKNISNLILIAVRRNPLAKNATQREVEDITKLFLRNASDREGGRDKRKKNG